MLCSRLVVYLLLSTQAGDAVSKNKQNNNNNNNKSLLYSHSVTSIISVVGGDLDRDSVCTHKLLEEKFDSIFFTGVSCGMFGLL